MKDKKSIPYIIGQVLALVFMGCIAACIGGVVVALTFKFLGLLF